MFFSALPSITESPACRRAICITALVVLSLSSFCHAGGIGVLLSREIPPYVSMLESFESQLRTQSIDRFFLDEKNQPYSLGGGGGELNPEQYDVLVAVGPGALRYLKDRAKQVPLVFGMVLNPQKIFTVSEEPGCGVTLNLPVKAQFAGMLKYFPAMARLGVLFDPVNNQDWYESASDIASDLGIKLVPLQAQRVSGRLKILGKLSDLDAILFIPDKTIISKAVIQHVIKQAVLEHTPVVGYNQFFYDSGATLAFIIDYKKIGQQVAEQVEAILDGHSCESLIPPAFDLRVNASVWEALQLDKKGTRQ